MVVEAVSFHFGRFQFIENNKRKCKKNGEILKLERNSSNPLRIIIPIITQLHSIILIIIRHIILVILHIATRLIIVKVIIGRIITMNMNNLKI